MVPVPGNIAKARSYLECAVNRRRNKCDHGPEPADSAGGATTVVTDALVDFPPTGAAMRAVFKH